MIKELDAVTIDQIAAGEVVDKPAGAVKEMVENAIDAGATHITVEIEDGGITLMRVTDDGAGIEPDDVRRAFLRHATSKIDKISDLYDLHTLGFRGEALSSIAAVARVEMITKTKEELTGIRYCIEGGREILFEEVGAPTGTTIIAKNLFFNTPAREKFLRKPQTEGSHVADLMEHMALSHPEIAFRFVNNHVDRFHTAGTGDLKENIYRIYGRDLAASVLPIDREESGMHLSGYLGKPAVNRGSRSYELFFVNGRYIRDRVLSMALEEGYREYVMQHKFPFAVLNLTVPPDEVDVNVHPSKMEVRFRRVRDLSAFITRAVHETLAGREMLNDVLRDEAEEVREGLHFAEENEAERYGVPDRAEPFEQLRLGQIGETAGERKLVAYGIRETPVIMSDTAPELPEHQNSGNVPASEGTTTRDAGGSKDGITCHKDPTEARVVCESDPTDRIPAVDPRTERILSETSRREYRILGQLFDTYWLIAYRDKLLLMDQHAAHEKVNYERMMKRYHEHAIITQLVDPAVVLTLTPAEHQLFEQFRDIFLRLGFEIEDFGDRTLALRGVPTDLYGAGNAQEFFRDILDELSEEQVADRDPQAVTMRIAGMACKASVKGNTVMSVEEVNALLDELLTLDNPYHCPHGRPTIITMSKYEIDKRFKRIVD